MSGVNFTLESAKRIAAAVRKVEQTPRVQNAGRSPSSEVPTSFWAMITGAIRQRSHGLSTVLHRAPVAYPHNPALRGNVTFNYSNHDGFIRLGDGNSEFLTRWTRASDSSIHTYEDRTNVEVAIAPAGAGLAQLKEASTLNFTSRVRTAQLNDFVVFENHRARYCAASIRRIHDSTRGKPADLLEFDYWILDDGTDDFSVLA